VSAPTLGLAVIAKDEGENLPCLLASVEGAFDRVALADTGSEDDTIRVFTEWAERQDLPLGYEVGAFDWCDDFAAAREFADSLLDTDWQAFADADDELRGAGHLRGLAVGAPPEVACLAFEYPGDWSPGPRVRLTRRGATRWEGRAHAVPVLTRPGAVATVPPEVAVWVHGRTDWAASDERDRRILAAWLREEPDNPRALALSGMDELRRGDHGRAADAYARYLDCAFTRRALGPERLATAQRALGRLRSGGAAVEPGIADALTFGGAAI
jgi:hypothetical protein